MPGVCFQVGRRIRAARRVISMDVEQFSEELNMSPDRLMKIEKGLEPPSIEVLIHAAKVTDHSLDFLLTGRSRAVA